MSDDDAYYGDDGRFDSGPFCRHWGELGCCDDMCACGHPCKDHDPCEDGACEADDCPCASFMEPV